jgi:predicted transposase YdaD
MEIGSPEYPVVLVEVQMHSDPGFHHRLAAQTYRFLQLHPRVEHWAVVVITPHSRLRLGPTQPLQVFLEQQVAWLSLEELSQRPGLDPLLNLLTLPVRPDIEVGPTSQRILSLRPDLSSVVVPMLMERYPQLSKEEIMVIAGIPLDQIRHTRAAREFHEEGRQEGRQEGKVQEASVVILRQLNRRYGPLTPTTTARIEALPLEQLEALAEALLDFQGPADLEAWLDGCA